MRFVFGLVIGVLGFTLEYSFAEVGAEPIRDIGGKVIYDFEKQIVKRDGSIVLTGYLAKNLATGKQQLIKHDFLDRDGYHVFNLVDYDFDGHTDLMLLDEGTSVPNMVYQFWRYSPEKKQFELDDRMEGITSIDVHRETLHSYSRSGPSNNSVTFCWSEGKLIVVEQRTVTGTDEGPRICLELYRNGKIYRRLSGWDWTSKVERPYVVTVENFDEKGKLISKKKMKKYQQ